MEQLGIRGGEMIEMDHSADRIRMEFNISTRALIGFRSEFLQHTAGSAFSLFLSLSSLCHGCLRLRLLLSLSLLSALSAVSALSALSLSLFSLFLSCYCAAAVPFPCCDLKACVYKARA
jgi:hypothetical protein